MTSRETSSGRSLHVPWGGAEAHCRSPTAAAAAASEPATAAASESMRRQLPFHIVSSMPAI